MIAALLDHLWQSSLFAACVGILTLVLRSNDARVRFWLWFAASMKFLLPFVLLTTLGEWLATAAPLISAPGIFLMQSAAQPFSAPVSVLAAPAASTMDWFPLLSALWAVGAVIVTARWLLRWVRLRRVLAAAVDMPALAPVAVKLSLSPLEPGLVGIWRPVILLPAGIGERLSADELDAILAHEICHFRRRDNLWAAMHMLVEALFWFHPLVWWLGARLNAERERACDESVLAAGAARQVYAESILKVCKLYLRSPLACVAGVSGADLKMRIETIITSPLGRRLGMAKKVLLGVATVIAIAAPLVAGASSGPTDRYMGFYRLATQPESVFTVTSRGGHVFARQTGFPENEIHPDGQGAFSGVGRTGPFRVEFSASGLVLHAKDRNQQAARIDAKTAGDIAAALARRIASNTPLPGSESALRRIIAANQQGRPAYDLMIANLAATARRGGAMREKFVAHFGPLQSLTFKSVSPQGWDIYDAAFAHGKVPSLIALAPDGKVSVLFFVGRF